ncbi:aspartic peptidase domain-containing protein [Zopfochytrium polystomum]|nr:aspartic peptidase domain-containing protein [Zopfochytrium polystomum]
MQIRTAVAAAAVAVLPATLALAAPTTADGVVTVPISKPRAPTASHAIVGALRRAKFSRAVKGDDADPAPKVFTSKNPQGSANLYNELDQLWSVNITLANGDVFSMDLDTGSSDTHIRGTRCTTEDGDTSCDGKMISLKNSAKYQFIRQNKAFYVLYGLGAVAGDVVTGPITLGGLTANISLGINAIELYFSGSDGLMGLGYDSISDIKKYTNLSTNWFDALGYKDHRNRFSFYLSNTVDDYGEVTFGGSDSSKFKNNIHWYPLTSETYFQHSIANWTYTVGKKTGQLWNYQPGTTVPADTIVDTGTTLVYLGQDAADGINGAIGAVYDNTSGVYLLNDTLCDPKVLPVVKFSAPATGSTPATTFEIPPASYLVPNVDNNGNPIPGCVSGFSNGGDDLGILGDVWIRAQYTIFDKNSNRVGFATAVHP